MIIAFAIEGGKKLVSVLFVCLGNICRSPTAEGVFRTLVEKEGLQGEVSVDSAGTAGYHIGQPPDSRSQAAARKRGIDMSRQRARRISVSDFNRFDYIISMDDDNHHDLTAICPSGEERRLSLFMDYVPNAGRRDVPDPYYGGGNGFEVVLDLVEDASEGLLRHIRENDL